MPGYRRMVPAVRGADWLALAVDVAGAVAAVGALALMAAYLLGIV